MSKIVFELPLDIETRLNIIAEKCGVTVEDVIMYFLDATTENVINKIL